MNRKNWKNYYLPFLANLLVCLGVAISIGMIYRNYNTIGYTHLSQGVINSIWICNFCSCACLFLSFYYFIRDIIAKKYHVSQKYFVFVYLGYFLSFLSVFINICFGLTVFFASLDISVRKLLLWICLGIDGMIWVISNTVSWYGFTLIEIKYRQKVSATDQLKIPVEPAQKSTKGENHPDSQTASGDLKSFV